MANRAINIRTGTAASRPAAADFFGHYWASDTGRMSYSDGAAWQDLEVASSPAHASDHERGGSDEIDGDHLDIDYTPTNYTPSTTPPEAANVDDLAAHLAGIDTALASSGGSESAFSDPETDSSTSKTLGASDDRKHIHCTAVSAATYTLDTAATVGDKWSVTLTNRSSNNQTINRSGSDLIYKNTSSGSSTSATLEPQHSAVISCDGTGFYVTYLGPSIITKGSILVGRSATHGYNYRTVGSDGEVLTADSSEADGVKWAAAGSWPDTVVFEETTAKNTNGQTIGTSAQDMNIGNLRHNGISGASLSSNQITLPAGTYEVYFEGITGSNGGRTQFSWYNVTDATLVETSMSVYATYFTCMTVPLFTRFTIAGSKAFKIQAQAQTSGTQTAANKLGVELWLLGTIRKVA